MKRSIAVFASGRSAGRLLFGSTATLTASVVASVGLLASGVALTALVIQIRNSVAAIDTARSELTQLRSVTPSKTVATKDDLRPQQRSALNQVTRQLNTPWSQLLDVLEASLPEDVALVSIEPDGASGKVRLQVEAKALETLIAYASTLRQQPAFATVNLVKHETNDQDANHPMRLMLEVTLSASRATETAVPRAEGKGQ